MKDKILKVIKQELKKKTDDCKPVISMKAESLLVVE